MNNKIKKALSFGSLLEKRLLNQSAPLFVAIGITNKCNYNCTYCYGDYFNQKQENFTTEELLTIIRDLKKMGTCVVNLIGGEPLIRDDIEMLVNEINKLNMICTISTNGSLVPGKINVLKKIDYMDTSLDGTEINNDKNRGQGTYKKTLEGIRAAVKNGIKVNVNMVMTKYNLDDIDEMINLAKAEKFTMSFNIVFESHSKSHNNYESTKEIKKLDDENMKNAIKKIIEHKKNGAPIRFSKNAYEYALNWPLPYGGNVNTNNLSDLKNFKPVKCFILKYQMYIDTDGRIYTCTHHKDQMPIIDVKKTGVTEGWKQIQKFKTGCVGCYTICNNDFNFIASLKPSTILETILD